MIKSIKIFLYFELLFILEWGEYFALHTFSEQKCVENEGANFYFIFLKKSDPKMAKLWKKMHHLGVGGINLKEM